MKRKKIEVKILQKMITLYYNANKDSLSISECLAFKEYTIKKIMRCPLGDEKTSCAKCRIQCYNEPERSMIQKVMRYSGPRILFRSPVLTLVYLFNRKRAELINA